MAAAKKKEASLTFRGFDNEPEEIEAMFGRKAELSGKKGHPVRAGIKTLLTRSFVCYSVELDRDLRLDEAVPVLIGHVGGEDTVNAIREIVCPEYVEVNLVWPIKFSKDQENGFFPDHVLSALVNMRCSLAFEFV